jgi:choice-of-anchor B domain-containing protein
MQLRRSFLAAFALAASVVAQGTNCALIGTLNQHTPYNDIWGYVAPNGKEYALLGATTGLSVVDCSVPSAPVERGFFPWATSIWRDIRTYSHYAYVSSEGGAGFQIIDLNNADAPVSLGIFGTSYFNNAHNVCIDVGTGKMYFIGCNTGTPVFDLLANPANPPFVGYALGSGNSNYFHDLCVENGYGYGSMIYNGQLRIMNMATFPPTSISNSATPSAFTHNAWPNAAGTLCVTTDERNGGVVKFFDITNKASPIGRGQFTPNVASIPHNAFLIGNLCHCSWYTEGYRCIDVSDPNNPVEVASYDTWPGASGSYDGAWGVYPFQPSGNIYISDITTGLHIVRPQITDLALTHIPLGDTTDEDGPYVPLVDVTGSNPISSVTLNWRVGSSGAFTAVPMAPLGAPGQYFGGIPGHDAPTTIEYYIEAVDSVASRRLPQSTNYSFLVGTSVSVFSDDFETNQGWTHGLTATQDDWQLGNSLAMSGSSGGVSWADAPSAFSGTNCWGNDLGITQGGSAYNGAYQNNVGNWLQSPVIATGGQQGLHLRFRRWLTLAAGDTASVLLNGNVVFSTSSAVNDAGWQLIDLDVSAMTNPLGSVTLRFELATNATNVSGGWTIDDVELRSISDASPPLYYGTGTAGTNNVTPTLSMSAPARLGTTTQLQGSNMLPNGGAFLVTSFAADNVSVSGIQALVLASSAVAVFQPITAGGTASWPFTVPAVPAFDNLYLYSQIITLDAGSPGGLLAASLGMRFRICVQ